MAPRCRGYRSRRLQAFQDDPKLLFIRPAPPSAGLNDLKPLNLSTVLMAVHKYCYTSLNLTNKAAAAGGIRYRGDYGQRYGYRGNYGRGRDYGSARCPRNFTFAPGGEFIIVGNQVDDRVCVLPLGRKGRAVGAPVAQVSMPQPACHRFMVSPPV